MAAGAAGGIGIVAAMGEREIDAELDGEGDDLRFGEGDERRVDADVSGAFDAGLGGEVGHALEGVDEFGAAIGIAGIIEGVDSDEDIGRAEDFGPGECEREEDGVAGGDVGDGNAGREVFDAGGLGDGDIGGESGAAESAEIDGENDVARGAEAGGDGTGGVEFDAVSLAVVEAEGVAGEAPTEGGGETGGGIEPTAQQADCGDGAGHPFQDTPGVRSMIDFGLGVGFEEESSKMFLNRFSCALFLAAPALIGQSNCPAIRFSGATATPLEAADGSGTRALLRQLDGTFSGYFVQLTAPYGLVSETPDFLGRILPCGAAAPKGSPFGGAAALVEALNQTGTASQNLSAALMSGTVADLALVRSGTASVDVYTVSSGKDTTVNTATAYAVGKVAATVLFADLNGDGVPDMIAADSGGGTIAGSVAVWLGAADGTFHSQENFAADQGPISIAAADFNHDGKLDLAVANARSGDVSILIGKGDGTFLTARNYLATKNPSSVAAADFNGDGKLDLAVADSLGAMVVALGNGDGTFQSPARSYAAGGTGTWYVAAGDFNGDGKADAALLSAAAGTVSVFLGDGDGSFAPAVSYAVPSGGTSMIVTDINDDGKQDILVAAGTPYLITDYRQAGYETLLLGNGDGTFEAGALIPTGAQPGAIVAADFNGDGKVDLMTANEGSGDLSLIFGLGGNAFAPATSVKLGVAATAMVTTDLNGDRRADVIAVEQAKDDIAILYSSGNGQFQNAVRYPAGNGPKAIALADFNSDRFTDIAVADYGSVGPGGLSILMGAGNGAFQPEAAAAAGSHPIALLAADVNKDGHPDLVVVNNGTSGADVGGVSVLLGKGDMTFLKALNFAAGVNPRSLALGDFNGDGNLDAAVGTTSATGTAQLAILLGKGDGTFGAPLFLATASQAVNIEAFDFNGDGKTDLAISSGDLSYFVGNGDGTFQAEVHFPGGPAPAGLAVADFNGDGRPDLAVADSGAGTGMSGAAMVLLNASPGALETVNAASFAQGRPVAAESIVSAFGKDLATATQLPPPPLGTNVAGTTVSVTDAAGSERAANVFFVSPGQVNYEIPAGTAPGAATVIVTSGDGTVSVGTAAVAGVAPGIFTANGSGLAAATLLRVHADGTQTAANMEEYDAATKQTVAVPVDLDPASDKVYLLLFGTGLRGAGQGQVTAAIGGTAITPAYAGAQGVDVGLDQVNVLLPYSLKGAGNVNVVVTAAGETANTVNVTIQ